MVPILHFRKQLSVSPVAVDVPGILVRNLRLPGDVPEWLALRDRAMAGETPAARSWIAADFEREMTSKPWWRSDWSWVAISMEGRAKPQAMVGAVTLAMRQGRAAEVPVVHWLLVDPEHRRHGIGRLLMEHLERAVWNAGWREVELETHAGWSAAVAFYHSMGYAPLEDRPPR